MASQFFQCSRCRATNAVGSRFCSNCGLAFTQPQPNIQPQKKNNLIGLWIALGCVGLCVLCGGIGVISDSINKTSSDTPAQLASNKPAANVPAASATPTPPPTFADLKIKGEKLLKFERSEYSKDDMAQFDEVMTPLRAIPKESKDYKEAQALNKKLIDKVAVIAAEVVVLGEKPKNSEWDGSVRPAENYLKQALNDYGSSEYISWSPVKKVYIGKEPYWGTMVKLRAKNAFGAYIVKDVVFLIRNGQVVKAEGL